MLNYMKKLLVLVLSSFQLNSFAQLPNGSTAPDFTLTDYYGTDHQLYSYLDAGKTVFVEIFAAHCSSCWNYHQTNTLKNLYNNYGPDGTDELMVLALEYDQWNGHNAFIGDGDPWVTQGNWLDGTPYPIFNVENPDRGVFSDYNVTFYPAVYKVCPDRVLEPIMISESEMQLHQKVQACQTALNITEAQDLGNVYIDPFTENLVVTDHEKVKSITVVNVLGKTVKTIANSRISNVNVSDLSPGIYLFRFELEDTIITSKLLVS